MDIKKTDKMWSDKLTWTFELNNGWLINNHTYITTLDCNTPFDWQKKWLCRLLPVIKHKVTYFLNVISENFTYKEWIQQLPLLYLYNKGWNNFSILRSKFTLVEVHTAHITGDPTVVNLLLLDQELHPVHKKDNSYKGK